LEFIDLSGCSKIPTPFIESILNDSVGLSNIASLNISRCTQVTNKHLKTLSELKGLTYLNISDLNLTKFSIKSPCLKVLDLGGLKNLKTLNIENSTNIKSEGILNIPDLVSAEKINVSGCLSICNIALGRIGKLKNVHQFCVSGCPGVSSYGLFLINELNNLNYLDISGCIGLTVEPLQKNSVFHNIETLKLSGLSFINDENFDFISSYNMLKDLDISSCNITDHSLAHIQNITTLEILALPTTITDNGISYITTLTNLKTLKLVDNKELTNKGVEIIANFGNLENFTLTNNHNIDDGALKCFNIKEKMTVSLEGCDKVTNKKLLKFQKSVRKITISASRKKVN